MTANSEDLAGALFDGITAIRDMADAAAASAGTFKQDLISKGWSEGVAENMAAMFYATTMTMIASAGSHG